MKHHHRHDHYHFYCSKSRKRHKKGGFIKRTIRGLAERFGIPRGLVIFGFVLLFLMSVPLAILTFLGMSYWIRHPGRLEDGFDTIMEKSRRAYRHMSDSAEFAEATPTGSPYAEDGFDFSELKSKFEDLEKRAGKMEEQVSSQEYSLNEEIDNIGK